MFEAIMSNVRMIHKIHPELRYQQIMTIAAQKPDGRTMIYSIARIQ